ncbi:MAG: zinc protease [Bradymonadia bacterium]|jgi:zinc protease
MNRIFVAALAAIALPSTGYAQDRIDVTYDNVHSMTLDNGLEVVVVESHAVPIATIEIAARNGAFTEPPELNGLSHLYEHMFFKANAELTSQEAYLARQRELGMIFNGTTGNERVNYYFTLQSKNLREGLEFMSAAIQTPIFDQDELTREREVVLGEYDRNEATPTYYLFEASDALLWFEYPSRKDSLGDRHTIQTATVEQMREMQQTYYIPNNSLLIISGDVTPEDGFAMAEEIYGDWEAGPEPFENNPIPEHPPLAENVATIVNQPVNVSYLRLGWHGPDTRNDVEATYAADVFSFILAQDASTFRQNLVESGIVLDVSFGYSTLRYVGPISLTAVTLPGQEEQAIAAIQAEMARFTEPDYFTDEQIRTAQTLLAVSEIYNQQSVEDLAHTLSYWWCSADLDYYLTYIDELYEVTRDEMQRYIETYVHGKPLAAVLMTSEEIATEHGLTEEWLLEAVAGGAE